MNETMTVREVAGIWNISERRVMVLCKEGKIHGARKEGRSWVIPANAKKPEDSRYKKSYHVI